MSHELTIRENGMVEMFSAGSTPVWHRLGQRTEGCIDSAQAMKKSGLDWLVEPKPLHTLSKEGAVVDVKSHRAMVRSDNGTVLGVVGSRYLPIQNHEAFGWTDTLLGEKSAVYDTAGSIQGGRIVWMLVRLPEELVVKGTDDVTLPYLLVCNSHDGSRTFRVLRTAVRVVCQNTLTLSLRSGSSGMSFRHTSGSLDRIDEARRVLGVAHRGFAVMQRQMDVLAGTQVRGRELADYFLAVVPDDREHPERSRHVRERLFANFDDDLQRMPGVRGTMWAAFNAVSQYTDWERPSRGKTQRLRDDRRLRSVWFGDSAALKRHAWQTALEHAGWN